MSRITITLSLFGIFFLLPAAAFGVEYSGATGGGSSHENMQPSLAVNHIIALYGMFPSYDGSNDGTMIGEISMFAGDFAPDGWARCDGQLLPINQFPSLSSILDNTYGGDGINTFALPDLRGRTAVHTGSAPGLTTRGLGQKFGEGRVTLTEAQMPIHDHTMPFPPPNSVTGLAGGNLAHTNMQPSRAINYNIVTQGLYPSQGGGGSNDDPFLGEIRQFAGNFTPGGMAALDGQLLSVQQNPALSSLLGTTYGGNGSTTFGLPDLRGRAAIHGGAGIGVSSYSLGQTVGVEANTLMMAEMPIHNHTLLPSSDTTGNTGSFSPQALENRQPSLAMNYIIALYGLFPSQDGVGQSENFIGEISMFAGTFAPAGWAFCDGQLMSVSQHPALFSLLGITYGGDGQTTFGLPDLRGRTPIHTGAGPGLTNRFLGEMCGEETVTLSTGNLPAHSHEIPEPATMVLLAAGGLVLLRRRSGQVPRRRK